MHELESVLENDTHKILWEFERQTDHLIPDTRAHLMVITKKKRTCHQVNFAVSANQ